MNGSLKISNMNILITGCAGFIGFHLSKFLLNQGYNVIGIDNLNHYYDVTLKLDRLKNLGIDSHKISLGHKTVKSEDSTFLFHKVDLINQHDLLNIFQKQEIKIVVNLAAQAGVRYSIENPKTYIDSNIVGFANLLEACRHHSVDHLVYASSSSVYGNSDQIPFKTTDFVDKPISLYAATKKSNELMAHTYSHLFGLPTTGLRFFTVYGPWGRPDMAAMLFAKAIISDQPIKVFNAGNLSRDFTYIDDIIEGVSKVLNRHKKIDDLKNELYKLYNIGNSKPVNLLKFIEILEEKLNKKAIKKMYPMQPGDVEKTYADILELQNEFDYHPSTELEEGIEKFVSWYMEYYTH